MEGYEAIGKIMAQIILEKLDASEVGFWVLGKHGEMVNIESPEVLRRLFEHQRPAWAPDRKVWNPSPRVRL